MNFKFSKSQTPLILAFALPIAMVVVVAFTIYIPRLLVKPHYDFVYALVPYSNYDESYKVVGKHLTRSEYRINGVLESQVHLFRYSVIQKTSSEVSFSEVQSYSLSDSPVSPEGFEITTGAYESMGLFPLFFSTAHDYNARYLSKGSVMTKINIPGNSYSNQFQFIGWIQ